MFLPILSAILGIIAFLPVNFYPAGFIFLVPLFLFFLKEKKLWRLILGVAVFRLIFALGTVYYTSEPIFWTSSLLIFLELPLAVFAIKKYANDNILLFSLPFLWTIFDLFQAQYSLLPTYIITAGNSMGSSPFVGLAGLGGLVSLTFFIALINALIAAMIVISPLTRGEKKRGFIPIGIIAAILIIIAAAYFFSQYQLQKNARDYNNLKNSIKIAAVSTNTDFNSGQFDGIKNELTGKKLDLIVFPEDIFNETADSQLTAVFMQNLAKELGTNIVVAFDTKQNGGKYNSAVLFDQNGAIVGTHNKSRLTFAGEYWPFGNWHPAFYDWMRKKHPETGNFAVFYPDNAYIRGNRKNLLINVNENDILFAAPICLEVHYPGDLKEYKNNGARFIINPTSNRWLSKGVKHFLYLTDNLKKIEAVQLKIPIISSGVQDFVGIILPDNQTRLIDYQAGNKNYGIFFGEIRY